MKYLVACAIAAVVSSTPAWAQSLKQEAPFPLQPGINKGTVDNFVGTQYWYLNGGPGKTFIKASFKPMGLFGNPMRTAITITLSDEARTWSTPKVMSSDDPKHDFTFEGELKKPTKIIVTVAPPTGGLVRAGGDYELLATGAVSFGQKSNVDPIIGTYKCMSGFTADLGATKFLADGSIQTASGAGGNWKLFDEGTHTYVINIDGQDRHSLQFASGRGLCDGDTIVFQQLK